MHSSKNQLELSWNQAETENRRREYLGDRGRECDRRIRTFRPERQSLPKEESVDDALPTRLDSLTESVEHACAVIFIHEDKRKQDSKDRFKS